MDRWNYGEREGGRGMEGQKEGGREGVMDGGKEGGGREGGVRGGWRRQREGEDREREGGR